MSLGPELVSIRPQNSTPAKGVPRAAMAFMKGVHGNTFAEFYDELLNADEL